MSGPTYKWHFSSSPSTTHLSPLPSLSPHKARPLPRDVQPGEAPKAQEGRGPQKDAGTDRRGEARRLRRTCRWGFAYHGVHGGEELAGRSTRGGGAHELGQHGASSMVSSADGDGYSCLAAALPTTLPVSGCLSSPWEETSEESSLSFFSFLLVISFFSHLFFFLLVGWVVKSPLQPTMRWLLSSLSVQREEMETSLPLSRFAELNLGITNATSRIDEKTRQPHKSGSSAVVSAMGGRGWGRQQEE